MVIRRRADEERRHRPQLAHRTAGASGSVTLRLYLDGVLQQYERFVKPSYEEFVLPTKAHADIIVPRGAENKVAIEIIAQHIGEHLWDDLDAAAGR